MCGALAILAPTTLRGDLREKPAVRRRLRPRARSFCYARHKTQHRRVHGRSTGSSLLSASTWPQAGCSERPRRRRPASTEPSGWLRAQLGAARAGPARATNLGLPNKRAQRLLTDRRARAPLPARGRSPIQGHASSPASTVAAPCAPALRHRYCNIPPTIEATSCRRPEMPNF
jgi:hypothetical protein